MVGYQDVLAHISQESLYRSIEGRMRKEAFLHLGRAGLL